LPNQNILPAVGWCRDILGKRRFFLVGSDAIYAHAVRAILGDAAPSLSVELVGESYVSSTDVMGWVEKTVRAIEAKGPDAILSLIHGKANLAFVNGLRARGITPARTPTLAFCFTEQDLRNVLKEMIGDYVCGHYFQGLESPENNRFLALLGGEKELGPGHPVSDAMEAAYMGVHLWATAVARAGTLDDLGAIRRALVALKLAGPGGPVELDPVVQCDAKYCRVGRVDRDRTIKVVWSSPTLLKPVAYPATRTPGQWEELVRGLHDRWGGHWSNRGSATPGSG
jgi:urea transport system substrate-binding protein